MDPISAVLAAVIEQGAGAVATGMRSALGADVTSVVVEYQGYQVPFSYQMWHLKPKSVCDTYRSDVTAFSGCTVAAKSLFGALCKELQQNPSATLSYGSLKNMYCTAAVSFQPTHATVQWSAQSQTDEMRQECRLAQAALLSENTPETRKRREVACGKTAAPSQ